MTEESPAVVPWPRSLVLSGGQIPLTDGSAISLSDPALGGLAERFIDEVERDCGLRLRMGGAEGSVLRVTTGDRTFDRDATTRGIHPSGSSTTDERYRIAIDATGIDVAAVTPEGVQRALTSLRQLIAGAPALDGALSLPALRIHDEPAYAWRGLSLDVVRTFFTPAEVRQVIDLCALYKLNVLHLHLGDDQGWRLEITSRPALTTIGASGALADRPGGFYTQAQFRDFVAYAGERFVTIVPELDMPGHAAAALRAYPELRSPALPPNVLDPDHPGVLDFVRDVVGEVAALAPGPFLHIGGDEAFGMPDDAYHAFVQAVRTMVGEAGKRVIGWQEITRAGTDGSDVMQYWFAPPPALAALIAADPAAVTDGNVLDAFGESFPIPREMVPMVLDMFRKSGGDLARAVKQGTRVLLSPSSHAYLDTPYLEPPVHPDQTERQQNLGLKIYPRRTVADFFDWTPKAYAGLPDELVVGVEAAIWCETIASFDELVFMLLPRLAGVAERAWTTAPTGWDDFAVRLGAQSRIWSRRGWTYFGSSWVDWT